MNRWKPSTVAGAGEMNRDTSCVVNIVNNDMASPGCNSRSETFVPLSTGIASRQFVLTVCAADGEAVEVSAPPASA